MVASTPQPPSGGMVGKKELLQWASQASGRIVTKFDELKDGDVLLRCMKETARGVRPLPPQGPAAVRER